MLNSCERSPTWRATSTVGAWCSAVVRSDWREELGGVGLVLSCGELDWCRAVVSAAAVRRRSVTANSCVGALSTV